MNILFISNDLIAGNLAYLLKKEGHSVKLYINSNHQRNNFDNLVEKTNNWRKELSWVGKEGLIIFDDIGYGKIQDKLRKQGYTVYGGNFLSDRLETERQRTQEIFKEYGFKVKDIIDFKNVYEALEYAIENPKTWVIKQNGTASKSLNYVGEFSDGRDVISVLKSYLIDKSINQTRISLQERIYGVEAAIAGFFNGTEWVGPIEFNMEHKRFMSGDIGPTTGEMGTLAWYSENGNKTLFFKETLEKITPYLKKINFRGHFDINCIVNKEGIFPLEITPRFGSPIVHLQTELNKSPWGELLYAIARGEKYDLKWNKGFGVVVLIALPPFPYLKRSTKMYSHNPCVFFRNMNSDDKNHIHFEEISTYANDLESYYVSDYRGYVLYVTGMGKTPKDAVKNTYERIKKIVIPKMIYRNDIGQKFINEDYKNLKLWRYI